MKTLERLHNDTSINIMKIDNNELSGTFFKEKPEVGDVIIANLFQYQVDEILENRDAKISSTCTYDKHLAFFKLKITRLNVI